MAEKVYADMVAVASSSKNPAVAKLVEGVMVDVLKQTQAAGITDPDEIRTRMLEARSVAKAAFRTARDNASSR